MIRIRLIPLSFLLLAAALPSCAPGPSDEAPRGNVLLVILDTTRADHLSAYGYERETTPALERLAAEGERYDAAWAQAPWTLPSIATILTGQPPWVHGAARTARGVSGVRPDVTTLAERMRDAGYRTGAFMNVLWCDPRLSHLDRGFERYDNHLTDESNRNHRDAATTTDLALEWLAAGDDRPFFLVVHYFDAHLTYDPPAPYDTMFAPPGDAAAGESLPADFGSATDVFKVRDGSIGLSPAQRAQLVARYDGELRFVDDQFARLRERLEREGTWDATTVMVTADHGEEFWDHGGFEHGHTHYREMLRVPLILKRAGGGAPAVRPERVRHLDLAPTLLEVAGLGPAADLPGRALAPGASEGATWAIAEGSLWAGELLSARSDTGTVIRSRTTGAEVYYAPDDVDERQPRPTSGDAARALLELLHAIPDAPERPTETNELTEEQKRQLRSLGYLR